jgi:SAM-dependent methyltransferase
MSAQGDNQSERLLKERDFHNARFADGDARDAQGKFYWAIEDGQADYEGNVHKYAARADVLEYGCANGNLSEQIAPLAKTVHAIDISDVAINNAIARGPAPNVHFQVMDAMDLTFPPASFDLVFGSGIIHHLDTRRSAQEIARVLRPGGRAVFWEPMGANPLINLYRLATPNARTEDEHPLLGADFKIMRENFASVDIAYYGLATLGAMPFRASSIGSKVRAACAKVDAALLAVPGLRNLAWYARIICVR